MRATKLRSDFRLTPSFNGGAETVTPAGYADDPHVVADVNGDLLALHGDRISRIRG